MIVLEFDHVYSLLCFQALPVLKTSDLLPYVVFITVPRMDQLNRLREYDPAGEPFNPNVRLKVVYYVIYIKSYG